MSAVLTPLPSPSPGLAAREMKAASWSPLPVPSPDLENNPLLVPVLAPLPLWSGESRSAGAPFPTTWPSPLTVLPSPMAASGTSAKSPFVKVVTQGAPPAPALVKDNPVADEQPDFTDEDLREAFGPIVEHAVRKAVYAKENGIDTYLEPMLRATIRRALAEYSPSSRPLHGPGAFDRFFWPLRALFSSRTYEDILFEKTRRFQVEEVFLMDASSLALISFASCDPARHASAKRVSSTVQRIALQVRDGSGNIRESFELPDKRHAISKAGRYVTLTAVVRGLPSELVLSDLEFSLRRIEDRFREQFRIEGSPLLHALQPFLEDCLLIQAPATAA